MKLDLAGLYAGPIGAWTGAAMKLDLAGLYAGPIGAWTGRDVVELCVEIGGYVVLDYVTFPPTCVIYVPAYLRGDVVNLCAARMPWTVHWQVIGFRPKPIPINLVQGDHK